ncbi:hypothetical protein [Neobacillus niacini]|nr:hypothetical protein [Neobacillus niacini]
MKVQTITKLLEKELGMKIHSEKTKIVDNLEEQFAMTRMYGSLRGA